ncbi:MAG: hypothetical protein EAX96_07900 [Candidatus Lokiarchaeota archaeon]|nr:hypothetical protein [Candidatus Lokiarchaeota archaeon]
MNPDELYQKLSQYFPNELDLMKYLKIGACWEYFITEHSTNEEHAKLHYFLHKKDENLLIMSKEDPKITPDLILYFTEKAILQLIEGNPSAVIYYERYNDLMDNPKPEIELDNKVNKPRLKLWRIGYKKWQEVYKF